MSQADWLKPGQLTQMTLFGGMEPFMMVDAGDNMFDISDPDSVWKVCRSWKMNFPIFHFSFGMPEKLEARNRKARERIFTYLKERGIHPAAYVKANGIFATSFFREDLEGIPEAKEWIHKTPDGLWFSYWIYPERYMICLSNEGWLEHYLLDRAKKAVDAGAEAIFLDNLEAEALCYCERCKKGFHQDLRSRLADEELKGLGVGDLSSIDPSNLVPLGFRTLEEFEGPFFASLPWKDRLFQEWIFYQMRVVAKCINTFCRRIKDYAREKYGREILVMPNFGGFRDPKMFAAKRINFELLEHDVTWFEWDYPHTCAQLQFVKALTKKRPLSSYGKDLLHIYGDIWHISGRDADPTFPRRWLEWYSGYEPHARIAVVCSLPTILFDEGFTAFERVIEALCRRIPVEAVSLRRLADEELRGYDVLLLPKVTCLSEDEVEKVMGFAEAGGELFASKGTSRFDEHAKPTQNRLQRLLAELASSGSGKGMALGKGRLVYFTSLDQLVEGVLSEVDHPVMVLEGDTDFLMTCRRGEELAVRIGGARNLILEVRKEGREMIPSLAAAKQEHLGIQPLTPLHEDEERMVLALPNVEGVSILNLSNRQQSVNLAISPGFRWIDSSEKAVSARVLVSQTGERKRRVGLKAEVFEGDDSAWRIEFREGGRTLSELMLPPGSSKELELAITTPDGWTELYPTVVLKVVDPDSGAELDRATLKLQRSVAIFDRYSIAQMGPDDENNLDRTGLGVVLFNRNDAIACRTATVRSHRGSPGRELFGDQLIPRNGVITGFVPSLYPLPRGQRPRFIQPFISFSPGLGSYLVSDRIYDQSRPEGARNFFSKVEEDTLDSVAVLFEFDQPPFHVHETIRANSGTPGFQVTYEMMALEDGLVYSWYLPRFGVPQGARVCVATKGKIETLQAEAGYLPIPDEGRIEFLMEDKGKVLILELGGLEPYGHFKSKSPFITSSNLKFESPILSIPVAHRSAMEVRKGDEYRFEFSLTLF